MWLQDIGETSKNNMWQKFINVEIWALKNNSIMSWYGVQSYVTVGTSPALQQVDHQFKPWIFFLFNNIEKVSFQNKDTGFRNPVVLYKSTW